MAESDPEYLPGEEHKEEEKTNDHVIKKSKVHLHSTIITDAATGKEKLSCNYCPKT